mgnify:CR=1 FL=1
MYWFEKVGGERQRVAQGPLALDDRWVVLPHLGDRLSGILNILTIPRVEEESNRVEEIIKLMCYLPPV